MKQQKSRREQFSQSPISASLPPKALSGRGRGSVLLQDEESGDRSSTTVIDMDGIARDSHPAQSMQLLDEQVGSEYFV